MSEENYILNKHSALVLSNTAKELTHRQIKLVNALLWFARGDIILENKGLDNKFRVTAPKIRNLWGVHRSSFTKSNLLPELLAIKSPTIEFNITNKDKTTNWQAMSILAEVGSNYETDSEDVNYIEYRFAPSIFEHLKSPKLSVNIDLKVTNKFRSKYAGNLYEILEDARISRRNLFSVADLRKLLGCEERLKEYAQFKLRCINKAISEIESFTNMRVSFEEIKTKNKVTSLRFSIVLANDDHNPIVNLGDMGQILKDFKFSPEEISQIRENYEDSYIYDNLKYTKHQKMVKNPKAYAKEAIKKGYAQESFKKEEQKRLAEKLTNDKIKEEYCQKEIVRLQNDFRDKYLKIKRSATKDFWENITPEQRKSFENEFPPGIFQENYFKMHMNEVFKFFYSEIKCDIPDDIEIYVKTEIEKLKFDPISKKFHRQ